MKTLKIAALTAALALSLGATAPADAAMMMHHRHGMMMHHKMMMHRPMMMRHHMMMRHRMMHRMMHHKMMRPHTLSPSPAPRWGGPAPAIVAAAHPAAGALRVDRKATCSAMSAPSSALRIRARVSGIP